MEIKKLSKHRKVDVFISENYGYRGTALRKIWVEISHNTRIGLVLLENGPFNKIRIRRHSPLPFYITLLALLLTFMNENAFM
jgi:hypothetical protein